MIIPDIQNTMSPIWCKTGIDGKYIILETNYQEIKSKTEKAFSLKGWAINDKVFRGFRVPDDWTSKKITSVNQFK